MPLPNDSYGRHVSVTTIGIKDIYTVSDPITEDPLFTLSFPTGTAEQKVYSSINSMAPNDEFITVHDLDPSNYDENVTMVSDETAYVLSLPANSKSGNNVRYTNGAGKLFVSLNGQLLSHDIDFSEVDSEQIIFLFDLKIGDSINIRIK